MRFSKTFSEPALQREYQEDLGSEKIRLTRIGVGLATIINASFVALDLWAISSALSIVWSIRVVMNLILALCFAATWHPDFQKFYSAVTAALFLSLGSGINAMIYVAAPSDFAVDAYYGGLLLTTFGIYTLTYINLSLSVGISLVLIASYIAVSVFTHNFLHPDKIVVLAANLSFFVAATVLGIVAQSVRERYSRENYLLRHSLERDIEMQEEEKKRASFLAEHDALTGLPNRLSFDKQAGRILESAVDSGNIAAVLFIDLDKFKPINDTHGHAAGDRVLKVIATRLRTALRDVDVVARFGGDEFVACVTVEDHIAPVTRKLIDRIEQPIEIRGATVALSASIGIAIYPRDGDSLEALIVHADKDMYRRKHSPGNLLIAES